MHTKTSVCKKIAIPHYQDGPKRLLARLKNPYLATAAVSAFAVVSIAG